MSDVRRPPLLPQKKGRCPWCGLDVELRLRADGTPRATQPTWHRECASIYRAAFSAQSWYDEVAARDGERCAGCGDIPMAWRPKWGTRADAARTAPWWWLQQAGIADPGRWTAGDHVEVEYAPALHVDHVVPLWKVADMPQPKRREYFLAGNCQLLCHAPHGPNDCHGRKTAREAAERAHGKRLAANWTPYRRRRERASRQRG